MNYILDINSIIELNNYNKPIHESLWNKIQKMIRNRNIYSVEEVYHELKTIDDDIYEYWTNINNEYNFFISINKKYWKTLTKLEKYNCFQKEGENYMYWSKPYLLAVAYIDNAVLVINDSQFNLKEQDFHHVCAEMNIKYITFNEFINNLT